MDLPRSLAASNNGFSQESPRKTTSPGPLQIGHSVVRSSTFQVRFARGTINRTRCGVTVLAAGGRSGRIFYGLLLVLFGCFSCTDV